MIRRKNPAPVYLATRLCMWPLLIGLSVTACSPDLPSVTREAVWIEEVKRGAFTVRVMGRGELSATPGECLAEFDQLSAAHLEVGQSALIDTRLAEMAGQVSWIAPVVQDGVVQVKIALEGDLPDGVRPGFSVKASVEVDRLPDALYVGRPAYGVSGSAVSLFKLEENGETAIRTEVAIGQVSVNEVEIRSGLEEGDQVIVSDLSVYDPYERIRLR